MLVLGFGRLSIVRRSAPGDSRSPPITSPERISPLSRIAPKYNTETYYNFSNLNIQIPDANTLTTIQTLSNQIYNQRGLIREKKQKQLQRLICL